MRNFLIGVLPVCFVALVVGLGFGFYYHPVITLVVAISVVFVLPGLVLLGYYIFLKMVKANLFWTRVESGWCRIVQTWGKYSRTLGPGLHLIGIPGIHTLYSRTMTFLKSATNEKGEAIAEPHNDKDISSFKTTRYPYALPFKDEEDSHGLHLSGILAVFAIIEDYEKAFFVVSDWYAEMNTRILKIYRDFLATIGYDDDIVGRDLEEERKKDTVSQRLWEALNFRPNGRPSVVEELLTIAGIRVRSVELVSIDPPEGWRDTTLAPYKAEREKEAAKHQAEASAILFDDTNQALRAWIDGQKAAGYEPTQAQIREKQEELRQRALAKTAGYQQVHIKGLENASTAVVGGGAGAGILVGGGQQGGPGSRNPGNNPKPRGNPSGGNPAKPSPAQPVPDPVAEAQAIKAADKCFTQYGIYPKWDPLKRTPN